MLKLLARLPLGLLYAVAPLAALAMRHLWRYRLPVVRENMAAAFPNMAGAQRNDLERRFYRNLADMLMESVKAAVLPRSELRERVQVKDIAVAETYFRQGRSVILLAAHQFNWEWMLLALSDKLSHPLGAVYKPLHISSAERFMRGVRARFGAVPMPGAQAFIEIMKRRNETWAFALVADQAESREVGSHWVNFLGRPAPFSVGLSKLAYMLQCPILFVATERLGRGRYSVRLAPLDEPPYPRDETRMIERYVAEAERCIREHPEDWLWTNRKWKDRPAVYGPAAEA